MKQTILSLVLLLFCSEVWSQTTLDSIQKLDEVVLSDVKLKQFAKGYKITVLGDSILKTNRTSLTDLLRFNSNIYFKENGYGMVSSPSFRGTNASQTAVIWNGININSQLNGQVDFNNISSSNYDNVSIRSGGGSVQYGSGAIGGTVHLSNEFDFESHFDNRVQIVIGSFDTKNLNYKASFGNENFSTNVGIAYTDSQNDYRFLGTDRGNENGGFNNLDLNFNLGYILSKKNVLKLYHQNFKSNRDFSATLLAPSNSKYKHREYRSMLDWTHIGRAFTSSLKAVHLQERFKYFENKTLDNFSEGKANTFLIKYNYKRDFSKRLALNVITDFSHITALGSSFGEHKRNGVSATAILSHRPIENLQYNLNVRQDMTSEFDSPLVFSGDANYQILKWYILKLNASKNFRVPTFNDLYWSPGGNLNLNPEKSFQVDLGHELSYKEATLKLNTYYIETSDLIQWRPNNAGGYWSPINIANTLQYGLEAEFQLSKQLNAHHFDINGNYSYTISKDADTDKQLVYVPNHKINVSLAYTYRAFSCIYQHLYTGEVFITDDNLTGRLFSLKAYDIANIMVSYKVLQTSKQALDVRLSLNNVYNEIYQNVASRPMPNRNFNIQFNYKF